MKKYKFLFFTLLLAFLFIPKDVFAVDTNIITPGSQELFWDGTNAQGGYESNRFNSTQNHLYQWGTSSATYTLYRFAPLVNFTSLGVDTSYKARVAFYVFTSYPYSYDDNYCTLWSANNEKFSCSLYRKTEDQIGSSEVLLTLVYDYEWTSSTGYVEFWANFTNFKGVPNNTEFMYSILDFQGNVSGNQIILDRLGETNKKLDSINDTLKNSFESCRDSINLFNANYYVYSNDNNAPSYEIINSNEIKVNYSGNWSRLKVNIFGLKPNTTYTISSYLDKSNFSTEIASGFYSDGNFQDSGMTKTSGDIYYVFTTDSNGKFNSLFYGNWSGNSYTGSLIYSKLQINEGSSPKSYEQTGKICKNRIYETNEKLDELNDKIGDLENSITSEDGPNLDAIEDSSGWLPPGPVDSILNLPLTFLNNLISNLSKTCAPVSIPIPFVNQSFQLPCISSLYDSMGITSFVNWVGLISGTLILYYYLLSLYKWVDNTIQMKDNNDWGGV